jgi:DNA-binding transcriptional ArsR family regulator
MMSAVSSASMPPPDATQGLLRAVGDPVRHRMVIRLNQTVATARELAAELHLPLTLVAGHMTVLRECGCVEPVPGAERCESADTLYRAIVTAYLDDDEWAQLPRSVRAAIDRDLVCDIVEHAVAAVASDTLADRVETRVSFADLTLDEQGWRDVGDLLAETLRRALAIQAASVDRLEARASPGPALPSRLSVLHYPLPDDEVAETP